jgi:AcrR family transcriptional regulator
VTVTGPHTRDTRTEILEVAAELFTSRGYDATSLREIAERLGITKAALYYHFRSKHEIMRALAEVLSWMVGMIFDYIEFFRLVERNRSSMQELHETFHEVADHIELHERVAAAAHAAASSVEEEIRMFAALGAVSAFDDWAPKLLSDGPPDVIQTELRSTVRAMLRV